MQCPYCKLEIMEAAAYCAFCRQPLAAAPANRPDGIWLIPPEAVLAEANVPAAAAELVGAAGAQKTPQEKEGAPAAKTADSWLPRLMFFLGIFIIGVGLGINGSNWLKLSARAPSAAYEDAAEKSDTGIVRNAQPGNVAAPPSGEPNEAPPGANSANHTADIATPPVPATVPAPALPNPQADDGAALPVPKLAPKPHRHLGRSKKAGPSRGPRAEPARLPAQSARRPKRSGARKKPSSHRQVPPAVPLQMAEMKSGSKRTLLNQCENHASWIEREKCRWHICSNQWGQHGCPAYPAPLNQQ
jgi:hypothetical protein